MARSSRRKSQILLAQRANIDRYPPVLHQIRLLASSADITVLDRKATSEKDEAGTSEGIERIRVPFNAEDRGGLSPVRRLGEAFAFARNYDELLTRRPDISIAYDEDTAAVLLRSSFARLRLRRVVHLHELPEPTTAGITTRLSMRYLRRTLRRADMVIIPDADRARIVASKFKLSKDPFVVMNCPTLLSRVPSSKLIRALHDRGINSENIVHYQGSIGPAHYFEDIITSMRFWPADSVFVVVGSGREEYLRKLRTIAASIGVENRVIFLGRVPYREVLDYAVGATVGLTLLEPTIDNQLFCAGASNKRFEYAALGIPQIANDDPGMDEVFGKAGTAVLLKRIDPELIGRTVESLLSNREGAADMGRRARVAHLSVNNYERQFAPVLEQFRSWLGDDT